MITPRSLRRLTALLAQRRQAAEGVGGVVEERQRARGVGPVVVAGVAEAEHAHAACGPQVQLGDVMAQRVGVEHADEDGELALAVEAAEVGGGVGDADLVGEVADHAADDLVAHLLLVARGVDEAGGGAVRGVGAVPDFRPAENGQRGARQAPAVGLDQVELGRAVLVQFVAGAAQVQRHGDVAVEGEHVFVQGVGLFDDLARVAGLPALPVEVAGGAAQGDHQGQGQADVQGFAGTGLGHCHLVAGLIGCLPVAHGRPGRVRVSGGRMAG
jgi:hypothetical protein